MTNTIDLAGLKLLDMNGEPRIALKGCYSQKALTELFIQEWIPYYECHKCGRYDYCKHVVRVPGAPRLSQDIKCGIFREALGVYVDTTFALLHSMTQPERQQYLDTAFHFGQFIFTAELWIGDRRSKPFFRAMGTHGPRVLGNLFFIRQRLEALASAMSKLQCFESRDAVLFVEGWSERTFLEKLAETRLSWFCYLSPQVYGGQGNSSPKRIAMLLEKYIDLGFKVFMQGDADGRNTDIFAPLINRGLVQQDRTFVFKHDFETSIPPRLAYSALRRLGYLRHVRAATYTRKMASPNLSFAKLLSQNFALDAEPLKTQLASMVGALLNASGAWWQDEQFMATELGKFLNFIQWVH